MPLELTESGTYGMLMAGLSLVVGRWRVFDYAYSWCDGAYPGVGALFVRASAYAKAPADGSGYYANAPADGSGYYAKAP